MMLLKRKTGLESPPQTPLRVGAGWLVRAAVTHRSTRGPVGMTFKNLSRSTRATAAGMAPIRSGVWGGLSTPAFPFFQAPAA
jgi:hypothetical protein